MLAGELVEDWIDEGALTKDVGTAVGTSTGIADGEKVGETMGAADETARLSGEVEDSVEGLLTST